MADPNFMLTMDHIAHEVLIWIGFGTVVGLSAKALMPGRDPGGAIGTMLMGVVGSLIGCSVLLLFDTSFKIAADYDLMLRFLSKYKISTDYIPNVLIKMRVGGESNKSLKNVIRKSTEDLQAMRNNNIGGFLSLIFKNLSKVKQFIKKD